MARIRYRETLAPERIALAALLTEGKDFNDLHNPAHMRHPFGLGLDLALRAAALDPLALMKADSFSFSFGESAVAGMDIVYESHDPAAEKRPLERKLSARLVSDGGLVDFLAAGPDAHSKVMHSSEEALPLAEPSSLDGYAISVPFSYKDAQQYAQLLNTSTLLGSPERAVLTHLYPLPLASRAALQVLRERPPSLAIQNPELFSRLDRQEGDAVPAYLSIKARFRQGITPVNPDVPFSYTFTFQQPDTTKKDLYSFQALGTQDGYDNSILVNADIRLMRRAKVESLSNGLANKYILPAQGIITVK